MPVSVDAGVGTASDAATAMELGADGVLMNTATAGAEESGGHGHGDEARRHRGAPGIFVRPHPAQDVREREQPGRGNGRALIQAELGVG